MSLRHPLLVLAGIAACDPSSSSNPPADTSRPDTGGGTAAEEPPTRTLRAVSSADVVLLWTSHPLVPGDRILRQDPRGRWTVLASSGNHWLDTSAATAYHLECGGVLQTAVRPRPAALSLVPITDPQVRHADENAEFEIVIASPSLVGLPAGLVITRDRDQAVLSSACAGHAAVCWSAEPTWWAAVDGPAALRLLVPADEPEPLAVRLSATLEVDWWGSPVSIAHGSGTVLETGRSLAWGDLHVHTGLSYDGCEDPEHACQPRGDTPAADVFQVAAEFGLDFAALTDHAEYARWSRPELGLDLSIWEETLRLVALADGGPVLPIVGFEWTARYAVDPRTGNPAGGHRTILFEELTPCEDYWTGGSHPQEPKQRHGIEDYEPREALAAIPAGLETRLAAADDACGEGRRVAYFHHPAMIIPAGVDWSAAVNAIADQDVVVEVASEHGSSECWDPFRPDCDWNQTPHAYAPWGSVQMALQLGLRLGFVGGTDSHDARPGSVAEAGPIASNQDVDSDGDIDTFRLHPYGGTLSGVLYAGALSRPALFDALEARHTLAASWPARTIRVAAWGSDGVVYLPGDEVPETASPLLLLVDLEDPDLEDWTVDLIDPWDERILEAPGPVQGEPFDLVSGQIRYVRIRATVAGRTHRIWASPFFAASTP